VFDGIRVGGDRLTLRFQVQTRAALLRSGTQSVRRDGLELRLRVEEDDETVFHVADQEGTVELRRGGITSWYGIAMELRHW
jgi:hypothetical protein